MHNSRYFYDAHPKLSRISSLIIWQLLLVYYCQNTVAAFKKKIKKNLIQKRLSNYFGAQISQTNSFGANSPNEEVVS